MLEKDQLAEQLAELLAWCENQDSPLLQADAAITSMKMMRDTTQRLSRVRVAAVRALVETGWSYTDIAAELDISRQRVEQLVNS